MGGRGIGGLNERENMRVRVKVRSIVRSWSQSERVGVRVGE